MESVMSIENIFDISLNVTDGTICFIEKHVPMIVEKRVVDEYTGNLLQILAAASLSANERLDICRALYRTVTELHKRGMIHGSICAANVTWNNGIIYLSNAGLYAAILRRLKHVPLLPCTPYRPREELLQDHYTLSKSSDLYSLSVLFYTIFSGKEMYSSYTPAQRVMRIIREGHQDLTKPPLMPLNLWNVLLACWDAEASNREWAFQRLEYELR